MRAFVVTAPGAGAVTEVDEPVAAPGGVVVDVERVGVCGTDVEFFAGDMAYLAQGHAAYPLRLGHEWCGVVREVGDGADDAWLGRRVTGDTMLGCGRCHRCRSGLQHVCADRFEVGIRGGFPGALAERLAVPASSLHELPEGLDATVGALIEPAGNALRAFRGAAVGPGGRVLVVGPGTIGTLVALVARAHGVEAHLLGLPGPHADHARSLGLDVATSAADVPDVPLDAVVDCSQGADVPAAALDRVEPGGRVVYIGLSGTPSLIDTRDLVLKDVTAVGVLSASGGLAEAIELCASGAVDPRPLVAATVGLGDVADVLAGGRPAGAGPGPKVHVDPRR